MRGPGPQQQRKREADRSAVTTAPAAPARAHAPPHPMRRMGELHRAIGNQAVGRLLQRKLVVNTPGDAYEREADRVADAVMRATPESSLPALSRATAMPRGLQRECSCGGTCDDCRKEQALQRKEGSIGIAGAGTAAPPIVHDVLRSSGQPLDAGTRAYMEPRFGRSFANVRIHADARAAESARSVDARAYTVGQNIVFAGGQYAPQNETGQRLLAHELAHTVQQGSEEAALQRACASATCPPVLVPLPAVWPLYVTAERCIQDLYANSHPAKPGISLSFNKDWVNLTGGSARQKLALGCLRGEETPGAGPNFTAKHGMHAGEPDIWDFSSQTMYEITTQSGAPFRIGKLAAEVTLANKICASADCGSLMFSAGDWVPPSGCFSVGPDMYMKAAVNKSGVIVYSLFLDPKNVALATALALSAAALRKTLREALKKGATKLGGKALGPAYAVASLTAMAILLASGRAEAKLGPGDDEPLAQLFEAMEQKGTPVPKEIQEMLDAHPELKAKMIAAMKKGGDPSKLQEELNKQILDTIAANKDQFTEEELELLLANAEAAGKALPKGNMTVSELKQLAAAAKAGKTGSGEGSGGTSKDAPPPAPPSGDIKKQDPKSQDPKDAPKQPSSQISAATRENLAKAPAPVRDLFSSLLGSGPHSQKLNDADVKLFLSIVPATLSADQLAKLRARLKDVSGESVEEILDALQAALAETAKPDAKPPSDKKPGDKQTPDPGATAEPAKPAETATLTTDPTAAAPTSNPQQLIQELAAEAKAPKNKSAFAGLGPGDYRIQWLIKSKGQPAAQKGPPTVGSTILSGSVHGVHKDSGTRYAGRIDAEVTAVDPKDSSKLEVKFTRVTPMVSPDGKVVYPASHFLGEQRWVALDPPKSKKK